MLVKLSKIARIINLSKIVIVKRDSLKGKNSNFYENNSGETSC